MSAVLEELIYSCMLSEPARRTARLEELCTSHPEHATALRERFQRLVRMGLLTLGEDPGAAYVSPATLPEALGPFRIEGVLGRGGMGIVYRGTQPTLGDRPVAIKALLPERVADRVSEARFVREGLLAARLQHPNLCPVIDVGKDKGVVYLAMPLIEGELLATRVEHWRAGGSPLDWREVVRLVEKLGRALHQAHGKGLVHRDVKPGNIMVRPDGEPVLLDFGLARDIDDDHAGLTRSVDVLGTPAYMAPEQADPRSRRADARTDVYALAATLFECLTLRLPHEAASRAELLRRIATEPATPLRRVASALPRDLEVVVAVALDTDPDRRYATAESFADDLARILRDEPIVARPQGAIASGLRWTLRNRIATALILTLAAGLAASSILSALLRRENSARQVGENIAQFTASRSKNRADEAFRLALAARQLEPEASRTLAPLLELLGDTRVATVFELPSALSGVAISGDGQWMAVASGDATLVFSVDEPTQPPRRLENTRPRRLAWLDDGEVVTRGLDGRVRRVRRDGSVAWERGVDDGERTENPRLEPGLVVGRVGEHAVVFAGTGDGAIVSLDLASGEPAPVGRLAVADGPVYKLALVPGRDLLLVAVATGPRRSSVFSVALDGSRRELEIHERRRVHPVVSTLTADRNGCYISYSGLDRKLCLGRIDGDVPTTPALARVLEAAGKGKIRDVVLAAGKLAVALVDEAVVIDLDAAIAAPDAAPADVQIVHQGAVSSLVFEPDGKALLTTSSDGLARRWDAERGVLVDTLVQSPATELVGIAAGARRRSFVLGGDGRVFVLEAPQAPFQRLHLRAGLAQLVATWDDRGRVLVSKVGEGRLLTVEPDTGTFVADVLAGGKQGVGEPPVDWTARLVRGAKAVPVWWAVKDDCTDVFQSANPESGMPDPPVPLPMSAATRWYGGAATPDGRHLALLRLHDAGTDSWTHLSVLRRGGDPASWRFVAEQEQHPAARQMTWLDDTHLALVDFEGAVRTSELQGDRFADSALLWLRDGKAAGRSVTASPDGRRVLVGYADGGLFDIDLATKTATTWEGHKAAVESCAFASDGRLAATADATGEVALWDAASGRLLCRWQAHRQRIEQVAFSPDGARIVTGSRDGTVAIWPTDLSLVDRIAQERAPRVVHLGRAPR